MENFTGKLVVPAGEIRTWQELIFAALDERVFTAGNATLDGQQRSQMKDRFRAATAWVRSFRPAGNIYVVNAYKGNVNGAMTQAAWTLPTDITDPTTGAGALYEGGIEYKREHRIGLASEAIYAAAETVIDDVNIVAG